MTTLNQALVAIAGDLNVDPAQMIAFAAEDSIGGYNIVPWQSRWPQGSMYDVEGQMLYAMVRAMQPLMIVEIGVWHGCSTTHLLAALAKNQKGKLVSFDLNGIQGNGPPEKLRDRWEFHHQDADYGMKEIAERIDMVFEDGFHERKETEKTLRIAMTALNPRLLTVHDSEHPGVGENVKGALHAVYGNKWKSVLVPPSDCGLAWAVTR